MAEIKLNKTELKKQKVLLEQLSKYLPTLQLKKQQLQSEVENSRLQFERASADLLALKDSLASWSALLTQTSVDDFNDYIEIAELGIETENVAGVDVPLFNKILFSEISYSFITSPVWFDRAVKDLRSLVVSREKLSVAKRRLELLEEELRQTNIKVNLFEKRMIPECRENIRRIKIFLGDQEIAAICNAKIAKDKLTRAAKGGAA